MSNLNDYIRKLDIDATKGEFTSEEDHPIFRMELPNSDEFAKLYSKLDNADWLTLQDGDLSLQDEFTDFFFINDDVSFALKGDLINNRYILEVREI